MIVRYTGNCISRSVPLQKNKDQKIKVQKSKFIISSDQKNKSAKQQVAETASDQSGRNNKRIGTPNNAIALSLTGSERGRAEGGAISGNRRLQLNRLYRPGELSLIPWLVWEMKLKYLLSYGGAGWPGLIWRSQWLRRAVLVVLILDVLYHLLLSNLSFCHFLFCITCSFGLSLLDLIF